MKVAYRKSEAQKSFVFIVFIYKNDVVRDLICRNINKFVVNSRGSAIPGSLNRDVAFEPNDLFS